jgi:hypothetical protein
MPTGAGETMKRSRSSSAAVIHIIVGVAKLIFVCRKMDLGVMWMCYSDNCSGGICV